jgi:hypothetical protein
MLQQKQSGVDAPESSTVATDFVAAEVNSDLPITASECAEVPISEVIIEKGENNSISIHFPTNNHGSPSRLVFNGIVGMPAIKGLISLELITTVVFKNVCMDEPYVFNGKEFPRLEHVVLDGTSGEIRLPKSVCQMSYLGGCRLGKNFSPPAHVKKLIFTSEITQTLKSLNGNNLELIKVNGQDVMANGRVQFNDYFEELKAINFQGNPLEKVRIDGLQHLEHLLLSHSNICSLWIDEKSTENLRSICIIGCKNFHFSDDNRFLFGKRGLTITYDDDTACKDELDAVRKQRRNGKDPLVQCGFVRTSYFNYIASHSRRC